MDLAKIDELLGNIKFDGFYIEATFQFKLLMQLARISRCMEKLSK
jgi:hypothetical protein